MLSRRRVPRVVGRLRDRRPRRGPGAARFAAAGGRRAGFIIASTRLRSVETARALAAGRAFAEDALFIEAPLPPPHWPRWLKLSPRVWGVVSRFWWWLFNHHDQQETAPQAEARADEAARQLIALAASGQDVLVVAHGFFNAMIGRALQQAGLALRRRTAASATGPRGGSNRNSV